MIMGSQQEAAGTAGRVADGHPGFGFHDLNDRLDERPGCEILACAAFGILCILLQQPFVDVALDVNIQSI